MNIHLPMTMRLEAFNVMNNFVDSIEDNFFDPCGKVPVLSTVTAAGQIAIGVAGAITCIALRIFSAIIQSIGPVSVFGLQMVDLDEDLKVMQDRFTGSSIKGFIETVFLVGNIGVHTLLNNEKNHLMRERDILERFTRDLEEVRRMLDLALRTIHDLERINRMLDLSNRELQVRLQGVQEGSARIIDDLRRKNSELETRFQAAPQVAAQQVPESFSGFSSDDIEDGAELSLPQIATLETPEVEQDERQVETSPESTLTPGDELRARIHSLETEREHDQLTLALLQANLFDMEEKLRQAKLAQQRKESLRLHNTCKCTTN
jgi:hypothetical protein